MSKINLRVSAICEKGLKKPNNQDNILVKIGEDDVGDFGLFIVADGVGGLSQGDVASDIVVSEFKAWWDNELSFKMNAYKNFDIRKIIEMINKKASQINQKIYDLGANEKTRIATTMSLLYIYGYDYYIIHIGDSRIYKVNKKLLKLTTDHSFAQEQVSLGVLTCLEINNHPNRNVITKALGVNAITDFYEETGNITEEGKFLICTDGFYKNLEENEILEAFSIVDNSNNVDLDTILSNLYKIIQLRGADDNVSAIIVIISKVKGNRIISRFIHR